MLLCLLASVWLLLWLDVVPESDEDELLDDDDDELACVRLSADSVSTCLKVAISDLSICPS